MSDSTGIQAQRMRWVNEFKNSGLTMRAFCRLPGTPSRPTLAKWIRRYQQLPPDRAFKSRTPRYNPHNRTSARDEQIILDYVKDNPSHGPQRIATSSQHSL